MIEQKKGHYRGLLKSVRGGEKRMRRNIATMLYLRVNETQPKSFPHHNADCFFFCFDEYFSKNIISFNFNGFLSSPKN